MVVGAVLIAIVLALAIGSLAEVHAQSGGFRRSTDVGFGALATPVIEASTSTGARLSGLIDAAPGLTDSATGGSARDVLQQGLDAAVDDTATQAREAAAIVPPSPDGAIGERLTAVMGNRATAVDRMRSAVDRLLGLEPLPVAGATTSAGSGGSGASAGSGGSGGSGALISVDAASLDLAVAGAQLQSADTAYRRLRSDIAYLRFPVRLPRSTWVNAPVSQSPLGESRLGSLATALAGSAPFAISHRLVVTALGLAPPAVSGGAPGTVGTSCSNPQSTTPGPTATILPPTGSLTVAVTVTNCGNVPEANMSVVQTLALADLPGAPLPPADARGGHSEAAISLEPGASVAPTLPALVVAGGHHYTLTVSVTAPAGQSDLAGSTQSLLLAVSP